MDEKICPVSKNTMAIASLVILLLLVWGYFAYTRHAVWPGKCTGINMKIENGEIRAAAADHTLLTLTVGFPDQKVSKVIVYDYCKGQVLSSVEAGK